MGPIADSVADQGAARVREAYVVAAPVSGRLERVDLHVGDRVVAGATVVARIRPSSADLLDPRSRAQAQAAVAAAQAAVGAARADQDRYADRVGGRDDAGVDLRVEERVDGGRVLRPHHEVGPRLLPRGHLHEIHLSDIRLVPPERRRSILRLPVKRA